MKQLAKEPTRDENLLDLALCSIPAVCSAKVLPKIADHAAVLVTVKLPAPCVSTSRRVVWDFAKADWPALNAALESFDWQQLLGNDVHEAVEGFARVILDTASRYIPQRLLEERKGSHPWLNDACLRAVRHKHACEGSPTYADACVACSRALAGAYSSYITKVKDEMKSLKRGSKKWWSIAKTLMDGAVHRSGIPPLRTAEGDWVQEPKRKADMIADMLMGKCVLPDPSGEETPVKEYREERMSGFILIRLRWVRKKLKALREDQATGPDAVPARLLKMCADSLCLPFCKILRLLVKHRTWPRSWRFHRISPLYKKGAVHNASNYRGLHLTCILSKVAERVLKIPLGSYFDAVEAFGETQFAFRKNLGCFDLILLLMCTWLLVFQSRRKVGLFLSDIAGAFDRVDSEKLLAKIRQLGVCDAIVELLSEYLSPRTARVVVDGAESAEFILKDTVFQGTVWGPSLWNVFFADVHGPATATGCSERKFADDLSAFKAYARSCENEKILADLALCQTSVHEWGRRERVTFEPSKEEFVVLDPRHGQGGPFRLLGPLIDNQLRMDAAIDKLYRKAKPKARALLRCYRFFGMFDMLCLYKAHVRSQIEWCYSAIYHAAPSLLARLDSVQVSFLSHLGLCDKMAFLTFNVAPLQIRRDICMLGVLWKIAHGRAHKHFCDMFPMCDFQTMRYETRAVARRHSRRFVDRCDGTQLDQLDRSLFGLVKVWNVLPGEIVNSTSVQAFQRKLTICAKRACETESEGWQRMYATSSFPHALIRKFC